MPKLSIVIPTFNSEATIQGCLQSIAMQTFTDYEVIVQDGSPNEDTARKVERFQGTGKNVAIRLFHERDRGPYDAMNKATSKARGDWLYYLGSDDELFDERVLATMMSGEKTAGCDVTYGNVQSVGGSVWGESGTIYDGPFDLKKLLSRNICHQAIIYRAEFARQVGEFNTKYALYADWDFNLRCWARTKFKYVDVVVAKYCVSGLSGSGKRDEAFFRDFVANVLCYFNLSLFSPLVNSTGFCGLSDVIVMQREKGTFYSLGGRVMRRLLRLRAQPGIG